MNICQQLKAMHEVSGGLLRDESNSSVILLFKEVLASLKRNHQLFKPTLVDIEAYIDKGGSVLLLKEPARTLPILKMDGRIDRTN